LGDGSAQNLLLFIRFISHIAIYKVSPFQSTSPYRGHCLSGVLLHIIYLPLSKRNGNKKEECIKKRLKAAKVLIISRTMGIGHKVNIARTWNCYPDADPHIAFSLINKICGYKLQKAICHEKENKQVNSGK